MNLGYFLFRNRGFTPLPLLVVLIFFARPTTRSFLVGFLLILPAEWLRIWSAAYLGIKMRRRTVGATLLVTNGPYAHVRNPAYLANMLLYTGVAVIANFWLPYFLIAVWLYFGIQYSLIVKNEEKVLLETFGEKYARYQQKVPRFLPRLRAGNIPSNIQPDFKTAFISERSTFLSIVGILLLFVIRSME